jgi:hypothetical protein
LEEKVKREAALRKEERELKKKEQVSFFFSVVCSPSMYIIDLGMFISNSVGLFLPAGKSGQQGEVRGAFGSVQAGRRTQVIEC